VKGINANPTIRVSYRHGEVLKEHKAWNDKWKMAGK